MARRRRGVRLDVNTGGSKFYDPNGTLPRSSYGVFPDDLSYLSSDVAVYRERDERGRMPLVSSPEMSQLDFPPIKPIFPRAVVQAPSLRSALVSMPSRVRHCVQRHERREVLFALGKAGYSGSAPKRHYRRNVNSKTRC